MTVMDPKTNSSYYSPCLLEELCEENRKKLRIDPDNHNLRCSLANALAQLGRLEEALSEYKQTIERHATPEYWNNYGKALLNTGKYEEAIAAFSEVLKAGCRWPDAHYHTGMAYHGKGDLEKADELLKEAVTLNPKYREALNERAQVLEALGRKDDAVTEYKKVIALFFSEYQMEDTEAYNYELSVLFDSPDLVEESIRQLRRFVQKYPGFADGFYKLGQALEAKGLKNEAMMAYRKALEINPRYETARKSFWKR